MSEGCCFETNNGTSLYLPSQNKEHCFVLYCIVLYCNLLKILIILRRGACSSCSASSQMKTQIWWPYQTVRQEVSLSLNLLLYPETKNNVIRIHEGRTIFFCFESYSYIHRMSEGCCFETNNGTSMYLPSQNKEHCFVLYCIVLYCNLLKILIILRRGACSSCSASSQMKTQIWWPYQTVRQEVSLSLNLLLYPETKHALVLGVTLM